MGEIPTAALLDIDTFIPERSLVRPSFVWRSFICSMAVEPLLDCRQHFSKTSTLIAYSELLVPQTLDPRVRATRSAFAAAWRWYGTSPKHG